MKNYELIINYRNGEVDKYYSRLTGDYWKTDAETAEEALEEMQATDTDTFCEIENNMTQIASYYVTEIM